jgi:hypothetical protein
VLTSAGVGSVIGCGALAFLAGRAGTGAVQELGATHVIAAFAYDLRDIAG